MTYLNADGQRIKRREKIQIINIRNERGDNSIDPIVIKRIIQGHCGQLYASKFNNLD